MPTPKPIVLSTFGGLGTRWDVGKVPPGMLSEARNIRFREESIVPRPGMSLAVVVPLASVSDTNIGIGCASGSATLGSAYSSLLVAVGGTGPYVWSIISGSLPTGLSLNSATGTISGTPSVVGDYTFTIHVEDSLGNVADQSCEIVASCPSITVGCPTSSATVGTPYDDFITASGGTGPYTFAIIAGALPDGLTLNTATGEVTGTPTTADTYDYTAQATDVYGCTGTHACEIVVASAGVFTAMVPMEMLSTSMSFPDTVDVMWHSTGVYFDPAAHDNVAHAWFQITAQNRNDTDASHLLLVDENGTQYADLTIAANTGSSNRAYMRQRVEFTPDSVAHTYMLKTVGVSFAHTLSSTCFDAKIILEQVLAAKTRVPIQLAVLDESTGGGNGDATQDDQDLWSLITTSATYGYDDSAGEQPFQIFHLDKSKFATIDSWELAVVGHMDRFSSAGTGYAALFDKTSNTMVTGSEMTWTGATVTRKTATIADSDMTDGHDFELRIKYVGAANGFEVHNPLLSVKLTTATKAEVYHRVGCNVGNVSGSEFIPQEVRYLHEPTKYMGGTTFFVETTGFRFSGTAAGTVAIRDMVLSDVDAALVQNYAGAESVITTGSGVWSNPSQIVGPPDNAKATWESLTANDNGVIEVGTFGFDGQIPVGATISNVFIDTGLQSVGQAANMSARCRISGVDQTEHIHSEGPDLSGVLHGREYDCSGDRSWVIADFNDANFKVRMKAYHPNNTTDTVFGWDFVQVTVGYGVDVSSSSVSYSTTTRTRSRTGAVTLVDGDRYLPHWSSTGSANVQHANTFIVAEVTA